MQKDNLCISNKEALKDKIHDIHNYIRNHGAGYGMNALKVFNVLYGLKKIEESKLLDKLKLKRPACEFSYLLKLAHENKDEKIAEVIFVDILDSIAESEIRDLLFYEIPKNLKGSVLAYLIKEIDKIAEIEKSCNVLLSGKIYEYFIGRDETAISELGAYFTDRHIVDYIYKLLDPELAEDNKVYSMIDMFGGSGGFTTGYINYINNKYPDTIKWKTELSKINHFDMNEDVIKSAGLEFFCLTNVLPHRKNISYGNTFTDEFEDLKYHFVITNPPYGGDKTKTADISMKRNKIKQYILKLLDNTTDEKKLKAYKKQIKHIEQQDKDEKKQEEKSKVSVGNSSARIQKFAKEHDLKGNDKESTSLILMMDLLEIEGTAIGVLKEGVIFNRTYKILRKCLIENFNVKKIISIPQDQFENTSTKTSIVIFENTEEKTKEVNFYEMIVERYEEDKFDIINNEIILTENKGDIKNVSDKLISTATRDEILKNKNVSLSGKEYNKREITCNKNYKLIKIEDVCDLLPTTKHYSNIGKETGKYRLYCSSQDKELYVDFCEVKKNSIILGQGGSFNIHFDKDFTPSKHVCVIQSKDDNETLLKYIYFMIPKLQEQFIINGSVISWLNRTNINNFQIPIPKKYEKTKEIVEKISKIYDTINKLSKNINDNEINIKNETINIIEKNKCENKKLQEVSKILSGTALTKKNSINGIYNVYGGGNSSYKHNTYNYDGYNIIISRVGGNKITLTSEKIYLTDNGFLLQITDYLLGKYVGYYLINNSNIINSLRNGSAQKVLSKSQLSDVTIKIPKDLTQIKKLKIIFENIDASTKELQNTKILYDKYISELYIDATTNENKDDEIIKPKKIKKDKK